ncbi:MAG TPA: hypothetical protein VJN65_07980, partial [Bacteroidota bacterium]|nr:hypothetical protein [Bacteroidota bacterium]
DSKIIERNSNNPNLRILEQISIFRLAFPHCTELTLLFGDKSALVGDNRDDVGGTDGDQTYRANSNRPPEFWT